MSLTTSSFMSFPPTGSTLHWYEVFFSDQRWREPLIFSLWLGVLSATFATLLGGAAAWPLARLRFPGRSGVMGLVLSPIFVPPIAFVTGVYLVWANFKLLGSPIALVASHIVVSAPFAVAVLVPALRRLDGVYLHAAHSLGANDWTTVRRVIVPIVAPSVLTAWLFALATSLDEVVLTQFILRPDQQTKTLSVTMFNELQYTLTPVVAVASTVYVALAVVMAALSIRRLRVTLL
jgi:ABC-type spermidine/putrescine transport system permease subunit II